MFCGITDQRGRKNIVLLDKDNALACLSRFNRGLQPCAPGTDNQYITKGGTMAETVGVCVGGCVPKPRCLADEIFIEHPLFGRTKEGFVVKSSRQNGRCQPQSRSDIERQVRPAVLAFCHQAFVHKHVGSAGVGFGPPTFADGDERIGFLDARSHNAARTVIFEAAPNKANAIAQQRGSQCVAFVRLVRFAVKAEVDHKIASGPTA